MAGALRTGVLLFWHLAARLELNERRRAERAEGGARWAELGRDSASTPCVSQPIPLAAREA